MPQTDRDQQLPARLQLGDTVRLVSPSTTPDRERLDQGVAILSQWGLNVEVGEHAFDSVGLGLAGSDRDRLGDVNDALRDPSVRAVFATRGGKGAYRIADRLDFDAVRADPKPLVGFSDITILQLALWRRCRLVTFHGPFIGCWDDEWYGPQSASALQSALMTNDDVVVERDSGEPTAALVVDGVASGVLLGGNLEMMATAVGWCCPSFEGCILLIESVSSHSDVDRVDRSMTQLINVGHCEEYAASRSGSSPDTTRTSRRRGPCWTCSKIIFANWVCRHAEAFPSATGKVLARCRWAPLPSSIPQAARFGSGPV